MHRTIHAARRRFLRLSALAAVLAVGQIGIVEAAGEPEKVNPLEAVVRIEAKVPGDSRSADNLGTERVGAGVMIADDGLILTIGYLILEADQVVAVDREGKRQPANVVGYDHATGFGLVRTLGKLNGRPVRLGESASLKANDRVVAASIGPTVALPVDVKSVRPFAGGWEYLVEQAIFTAPPIPDFGGAALFNRDGRLLGIGSLIVGDVRADGSGEHGNMFVPIDILKPILADLLAYGRSTEQARPWLGLYPSEVSGVLVVGRVADGGPAAEAGVRRGDILLGVGDTPTREMAEFLRAVWAVGPAGAKVPLKILRSGAPMTVEVESRDRMQWLKLNRTY